jgi:hypothetical protein
VRVEPEPRRVSARRSRARIFSCFDVGHDEDLHSRLLAQSRQKGSLFEISGSSGTGVGTPRWEQRVRRQIHEVDQVVVICGEHTDVSAQVSAELRITREEGKPYLLLWGRRGAPCTKPAGARPDDGMYRWTRETLRERIASALRNAHSLAAAARYRRPG